MLVKNQTTASQNGIYKVDTGAWTRDKDFDGVFDVVKGTLVHVTDGTVGTRTWYEVTTANPITPGTTSLTLVATIADAANIVFTQSGTTFARTVQDKERDTVCIKDFGALHNDATSGNAAATAILGLGLRILIPENFTWRTNAKWTPTAPMEIAGANRITSVLQFDVNDFGIETLGSTARMQLDNLTLSGLLANANSAGLNLFDNSARTISRLNVQNFSKQAVRIVQSVTPVLKDIRGSSVGTGVEINPGVTASVAPHIEDVYISSATLAGINITGSCTNAVIVNPIMESCAIGIKASSASGRVINPGFETNTQDWNYTDCALVHEEEWRTGSGTFANTYTGSISPYQKFQFKDQLKWAGIGGMQNATSRINSAANTWENVLFDGGGNFSSPYLNPNPGGSSFDQIQIIERGLYEIEYTVTWQCAAALAGLATNRLTKNGTEIPGSFASANVPAIAAYNTMVTRKVIVECAALDIIRLQFAMNDATLQIRIGATGAAAPTSATNASIIVRHTGWTSALS